MYRQTAILITKLLLGIILLSACSQQAAENFIEAKVLKVIDGDTIKVLLDGKEQNVRMLLVDTPETGDAGFADEATQFAVNMLDGAKVQLETDGPLYDRYERFLAYVWIDGQIFNELLLSQGLARLAYIYDPPYTHHDRFKKAEEAARKAELGIWSVPGYVTKDGFEPAAVQEAKQQSNAQDQKTALTLACDHPQIKGNISSSGEKIYHIPNGQYYERTIAEMMFCSEDEAVEAGFRKSVR